MRELRFVRPATADDYEAYVRLLAELGVDDPAPPKERWVADMAPNTLVYDEGSGAVGYVFYRLLGHDVHVANLAVAKEARRRGVGKALMGAVAKDARAKGCETWALNVKVENEPAITLYRSLGFTTEYEAAYMRIGWDAVARLPGGEEGISTRTIEPHEDAALEAALNVQRGRIAERRAREGWVLLRLVDEARPSEVRVGFACFNPVFPNSFPFRVARPTLARPLLEAIRPHARPEHDYTQLMVEGDEALRDVLVAIGAEIKLDLLYMSGPIPELVL